MSYILSGIYTLDQHLKAWFNDIDRYRPTQCSYCGKSGLWSHGVYYRQAGCENPQGNPAPIPRFLCQHCQRTCSTLPEYIPPRRWFHWLTQQIAFQLKLAGLSLMQIWQAMHDQSDCDQSGSGPPGCGQINHVPSLCTLQRWMRHQRQRFPLHQFHLLNAYPALGYSPDFEGFWQACLNRMPLSSAMVFLNRHIHLIP